MASKRVVSPAKQAKRTRTRGNDTSCALTGIVSGETAHVANDGGAWSGSTMQLVSGTVPPSKTHRLHQMHKHAPLSHDDDNADLADAVYYQHLYTLVGYRNYIDNIVDIRAWVLENEVEGGMYTSLLDCDTASVIVTKLSNGTDTPVDIDHDALETVLGVAMHPREICARLTPSSDDRSRAHVDSLFTLDNLVLDGIDLVDNQAVLHHVVDMSGARPVLRTVGDLLPSDRGRLLRTKSNQGNVFYVLFSTNCTPIVAHDRATRVALAKQLAPACTPSAVEAMVERVDGLPMPMLFSLARMVIRTGARSIRDHSVVHTPESVLAAVMACVIGRPFVGGSAVCNGLSALVKELVLGMFADAWPAALDADSDVFGMAACGALAWSRSDWRPSLDVMHTWMRLALGATGSSTICAYDLAAGRAIPARTSGDFRGVRYPEIPFISFLMDNFMPSVAEDRALLHAVALQCAGVRIWEALRTSPLRHYTEEVPIEHSITLDARPELPYLAKPGSCVWRIIDDTKAVPLATLMARIHTEVLQLNPRRHACGNGDNTNLATLVTRTSEQRQFFDEVREMQATTWRAMTHEPTTDTRTFSDERDGTLEVIVPRAWLAWAVGLTIVKHRRLKYAWSLSPDDPSDVHIARHRERSRRGFTKHGGFGGVEDDDDDDGDDEKHLLTVREQIEAQLCSDAGIKRTLLGKVRCIRLVVDNESGSQVAMVDDQPWEDFRYYQMPVRVARWDSACAPPDSFMCRRVPLDASKCVLHIRAILHRVSVVARRIALSMMQSHDTRLVFSRPRVDGSMQYGSTLVTSASIEAWQACKAVADLSSQLLEVSTRRAFNRMATPADMVLVRRSMVEQAVNEFIAYQPRFVLDSLVQRVCEWFVTATGGKAPHQHQVDALRQMGERTLSDNHRAHFVWIDVGGGKTLLSVMFARLLAALHSRDPGCAQMVFITSPGALETVTADIRSVGLVCSKVTTVQQAATLANRAHAFHCVTLSYDSIRKIGMISAILPLLCQSVVVLDEIHQCCGNETMRHSCAATVASLADTLLMMSATPLRSFKEMGNLCAFVQHTVAYPCHRTNDILVAAPSIIRTLLPTVVPHVDVVQEAHATDAERELLMRHVPVSHGGKSDARRMEHNALKAALSAAYDVSDRHVVNLVCAELRTGARPFVVCRSFDHVQQMFQRLCDIGVPSHRIYRVTSTSPIPDYTANRPHNADVRVALVPICRSTGYSFTWFNVRIRAVFPSSEHSRYQIDGRIVRIGQPVNPVRLITVHCGITSIIMNNHALTSSIVGIMNALNGAKAPSPSESQQ